MSATFHREGTASVSVAGVDPEFSIPSVSDVAPPRTDPTETLRRRRRLVVIVVAGIVATLVLHQVIGVVMAGQRQRHLANEVRKADASIRPGDAAMVLQIPVIDVNLVVAEGASSTELRGGPGRVIGSAQVADGGNVVVVGRRSRFGGAFERLGELTKGTAIAVQSRGGLARTYTVSSVAQVSADDDAPLRPGKDRLTLVTSADGLLTDRRVVVVAAADGPPPEVGSGASASPTRLGVDALDERSTSSFGLIAAVLVLLAAVVGLMIGIRRLGTTYAWTTVAQVVVPIVALVMIVSFIIGDSLLPTTL